MIDHAAITVAILSGGLGTRLRPVVRDKPKGLVAFSQKPILAILMDQLVDAGFKYVVLCTGYLGDQIKKAFGETYRDLNIVYSQEYEALGTAGSLRLALDQFKSDPVMVMNGDSFCRVNYGEFIGKHAEQKSSVSILVTKVPDAARFGQVDVDPDGIISKFKEKGGSRGSGWINAGVYLIAREYLEMIPPSSVASLEHDMFPQWIRNGIYGHKNQGPFIDIGTPESFVEAKRFFPRYLTQ